MELEKIRKAPPGAVHSGRYLDSGATISKDGRYRYLLWREWRGTHDPKNWNWYGAKDGNGVELGEPKPCLFIMFNPSTADGSKDDATIRRCVSFAKAWGYERLEVVNLFAFRATKPADLFAVTFQDDPVGPENLTTIRRCSANAGIIICAWGNRGSYLDQDETVLGWLGEGTQYALGLTSNGQPRHPLYVRGDSQLIPFNGASHRKD